MSATPRPAATVIVLRDDGDDVSVFLVQRHARSGFMPDAWVFPGGRVDAGDALYGHPAVRGGERVLRQLELPVEEGAAFLLAAVRETWEEAGIWLGTGSPPEDTRDALQAGTLALRDLLETHALTVDLDRLRAWSWWVTPEIEPKRYDTRFVVARVDRAHGSHDRRETVQSAWMTPSAALAGCDDGSVRLAPPTWWTLKELAEHRSVDAVLAAAERRSQARIQPVLSLGGQGVSLCLPGHPSHPDAAVDGLPTAIRLERGRWWAD